MLSRAWVRHGSIGPYCGGELLMDESQYATDAASGAVSPLDRNASVWIAGHRGLSGHGYVASS